MIKGCVKIVAGEPTLPQLSAWARLWALLLSPELQGPPVTVDETVTGLQTSNAVLEDERDSRRSNERSTRHDSTRPL
jgi:hypothetical protein